MRLVGSAVLWCVLFAAACATSATRRWPSCRTATRSIRSSRSSAPARSLGSDLRTPARAGNVSWCMLYAPCSMLSFARLAYAGKAPASMPSAQLAHCLRPSIPRGLGLPVESNRPFQPVSQSARENSCDAFARMVPAPNTYSSADMTLHARPGTPRGVCVDKCAAPRPLSRND